MAIGYHVYWNGGAGGLVDYSTPIQTTTSLSWSPPALAHNSDNTFAVRAYDAGSGFEEANVDATVRIVIDGSGVDITNRPAAPVALTIERLAGAGLRVRWMPNRIAPGGKPTGYHVYVGTPTPNFATPAATVLDDGGNLFKADITGLADGTTYQACVRAYNASGDELNTITASAIADGTAPNPVQSFAVVATFTAP